MEGRWIPSGKAERPPSNAIYVHNESPNFGAHWMKEPVNFSKLKLSNKKSEPGMVSYLLRVDCIIFYLERKFLISFPTVIIKEYLVFPPFIPSK